MTQAVGFSQQAHHLALPDGTSLGWSSLEKQKAVATCFAALSITFGIVLATLACAFILPPFTVLLGVGLLEAGTVAALYAYTLSDADAFKQKRSYPS